MFIIARPSSCLAVGQHVRELTIWFSLFSYLSVLLHHDSTYAGRREGVDHEGNQRGDPEARGCRPCHNRSTVRAAYHIYPRSLSSSMSASIIVSILILGEHSNITMFVPGLGLSAGLHLIRVPPAL
jgi:hypothetical protein